MIKDLKTSNTSQWSSKLKRLCAFDQKKLEPVSVKSLKHLSDDKQAEEIANKFEGVSQGYERLRDEDIKIPEIDAKCVPKFPPKDVQKHLKKDQKINTPRDLPPPPQLKKIVLKTAFSATLHRVPRYYQ